MAINETKNNGGALGCVANSGAERLISRDRLRLTFAAPLKNLHQLTYFGGQRHRQVLRRMVLIPIALVGEFLEGGWQGGQVEQRFGGRVRNSSLTIGRYSGLAASGQASS
jgi:hypothetical protein